MHSEQYPQGSQGRQRGMPYLPRSNLPANQSRNGNDVNQSPVTVAAVDESFSNRYSHKLTYLVIACSLPNSLGRDKLPTDAVRAQREPEHYGLVFTGLVLPPWTNNKERFVTWRDGVLYGLSYADQQLKERGLPQIGVALIDGKEPGGFWDGASLDGWIEGIDVRFAPKIRHHYDNSTDPFAAKLLGLADRVVAHIRQRMDERGDLEAIVKQLTGQQSYHPYVFPLLSLHGQNGNNGSRTGNGHMPL